MRHRALGKILGTNDIFYGVKKKENLSSNGLREESTGYLDILMVFPFEVETHVHREKLCTDDGQIEPTAKFMFDTRSYGQPSLLQS